MERTKKRESINGIERLKRIKEEINNIKVLVAKPVIEELKKSKEQVSITIDNKIKELKEKPLKDAEDVKALFRKRKVKKEFIDAILEAIEKPVCVGIDMADIKAITSGSKKFSAVKSQAIGKDKIKNVVKKAKLGDLSRVKGAIIVAVGDNKVTMEEIQDLVSGICDKMPDANLVWAFKVDDKLKDKIKIYLLFAK